MADPEKDEKDRLFTLFTEFLKSLGPSKYGSSPSMSSPKEPSPSVSSPISVSSQISVSSPISASSPIISVSSPISASESSLSGSRSSQGISSSQFSEFTAEDLLRKKSLRGKPNAAQQVFHQTIKDCAVAAHIWSKAPKLEGIPTRKREAFLEKILAELPQLKAHKIEIWKRLGQHLQNRRKYLLDKSVGKRKLGKKSPNASSSRPQKSPRISKSPRCVGATQSPKYKRKSATPRKSTPRSGQKKSLSTNSNSARDLDHGKITAKKSTASLKTKVVRPLFKEDESKQTLNGSQVYIKSKDDITIGKGIIVSSNEGPFAEVCLLMKMKMDLSNIELYAESDGNSSFADLNIHQKFLWRKDRLQAVDVKAGCQKERNSGKKDQKDKNLHDSQSDKHSDAKVCDGDDGDTIKLVVMEWTGGEVYVGVLLETITICKVLSCRRPIIRITDVKGSAFDVLCSADIIENSMININQRDIQDNPDMDFLVWEPSKNLYNISGKKNYNININNHRDFIRELKKAMLRYLAMA